MEIYTNTRVTGIQLSAQGNVEGVVTDKGTIKVRDRHQRRWAVGAAYLCDGGTLRPNHSSGSSTHCAQGCAWA